MRIISDNGKTFKAAAKMIEALGTSKEFRSTWLMQELNGVSMLKRLHGGEGCSNVPYDQRNDVLKR